MGRRTRGLHRGAGAGLLAGLVLTLVTGCSATSGAADPVGVPTHPGDPVRGGPGGPVVTIAGDIGDHEAETARLVEAIDPDYVLTAGDNAYHDGTQADYAKYDATWGHFLAKTYPAPGNHDYHDDGTQPYYFTYFAGRLPDQNNGEYYAFNVGTWRLYSLNCEISCSASSPQATWLAHDLATAGKGRHKMAYLHRPRYSCGDHGSSDLPKALWDVLLAARTDIVVAGHDHNYQRYPRMNADGGLAGNGIMSFVTGTGGADFYAITGKESLQGCSLVQFDEDTQYGVLQLTLGRRAFSWALVTVADTVLDRGRARTLDRVR
jgi:hypothetical protein